MSKLDRLQKSILDMTHDERMAMLHLVREDRKLSKMPIVREKKQAVKSDAFEKMIQAMSPEERLALLAQLGAQPGGSDEAS